MSDEAQKSKRDRGVEASTAKLMRALAAAGLKTQTAVAERIAELEGLDTAPRGLVNKVFAGERVDPISVERVARALGVAGFTLYRSADERDDERVDVVEVQPRETLSPRPDPPRPVVPRSIAVSAVSLNDSSETLKRENLSAAVEPPDTLSAHNHADGTPPSVPPSRSINALKLAGWMLAPIAFSLVIFVLWRASRDDSSEATAATTVMVMEFSGERGADLEHSLNQALAEGFRVLPRPAGGEISDPQMMLADATVDGVVTARWLKQGRWLGVFIDVHRSGSMRTAFAGVLRSRAAPQEVDQLMARAAAAVADESSKARAPEALRKLLSGRNALDQAATELNVRRALTEFESLLRADANDLDARVGLCEALVLDNVRTGDVTRLTEAEIQCSAALKLQPNHLEARRVQAYLDRKQGKLEQSLRSFEGLLAEVPMFSDAWLGIAEVHVTRFGRGDDVEAQRKAVAAARRAEAIEANFWKVPFTLARALYLGEDLDATVAAAERSVALDANVIALSNLGSFQFCRGDFPAARSTYQQAKSVDGTAFVGDAQLAVVHYFLRDFPAAIAGFKAALAAQEGAGAFNDHRLVGNYADALRHAERYDLALDAYSRAIALAETAAIEGDGNVLHRSYLAFYREMVAEITEATGRVGVAAQRMSEGELRTLTTAEDPFALMYLASVFERRGWIDDAQQLRHAGATRCPGFDRSPDLSAQNARVKSANVRNASNKTQSTAADAEST